jgi:hypothetical protein
MQDERPPVGDLDELGQVLLGLLGVNERRRVVAEHAEVPIDVHVHRRGLHVGVVERFDDDAAGLELLADRPVRQNHAREPIGVPWYLRRSSRV